MDRAKFHRYRSKFFYHRKRQNLITLPAPLLSDWLSNFHRFFTARQPFVVATVISYHGNSPDQPGAGIFYSAQQTVSEVHSSPKSQQMMRTARRVLDNPTHHFLEKIPLGDVAATPNGYCDVIYEYFAANEYPQWLEQLLKNNEDNIVTTLVRKFYSGTHHQPASALPPDPEQDATTSVINNPHVYSALNLDPFLQSGYACQLVERDGRLFLLRRIQKKHIRLTVVGNHPVVKELVTAVMNLPVDLNQFSAHDSIDTDLANIPQGSYVIVMTGDHALDFQCCQTLLYRDDLPFVGCIGSTKKAALFKQRLAAAGIAPDQLYMPVGLKAISGKQTSVVAMSILAQVLSKHQW